MAIAQEFPFYFGRGQELFGLFHPVADAPTRAVLMCAPLGQEQIRCHRLYRQLAQSLVQAGVPVLRFDYFGSGDSAGASAQVDWERCVADTVAASDELRRRSGVGQVVAFGARLGGSVALAAAAAARFAALVAWDPILDGAAYVQRLETMQQALALDTSRFGRRRLPQEVAQQWLGFAVSGRLREQLRALKLGPSPVPTLLLDSCDGAAGPGWSDLALEATVKTLQPPTPWDDLSRLELAILSHPLIQAVTGHLREAA